MIESDLLYRQLDEREGTDDVERTLLSLLHGSFDDEKISISHYSDERIEYHTDLVEPGRFSIETYTVERKGPDTFRVEMTASYDDMMIDDASDADFHTLLDGTVSYNLVIQVGQQVHAGKGTVRARPDL